MKPFLFFLLALATLSAAHETAAQSTPSGFKDEFLTHFRGSTDKLVALSEAIPADKFGWSPQEGVMSIGQVYMHIARYNYYYPETALGIAAPDGIDVPNLEQIADKEAVVAHLKQSIEHVRTAVEQMTEEDLARPTRLYGRDMARWGVLFQLLAHMNEHVGQSVSYARMNDIAPPWSR
jgi:uncharacterized damage-inducible protein DinB